MTTLRIPTLLSGVKHMFLGSPARVKPVERKLAVRQEAPVLPRATIVSSLSKSLRVNGMSEAQLRNGIGEHAMRLAGLNGELLWTHTKDLHIDPWNYGGVHHFQLSGGRSLVLIKTGGTDPFHSDKHALQLVLVPKRTLENGKSLDRFHRAIETFKQPDWQLKHHENPVIACLDYPSAFNRGHFFAGTVRLNDSTSPTLITMPYGQNPMSQMRQLFQALAAINPGKRWEA